MMKKLVAACGLAASVALGAASPDSPSPVADAAMRRDGAAVRALVRQGGDVNAAQGDGMTPLHWAASYGDGDLAGVLLYAGANVRATTRLGGYTPLHLASQNGSAAVINALTAAGASVAATTTTGATPLMLAASAGHLEAVRALLDRQADPNAKESANGETALMFAAALDRADVVKLLVERGADASLASKVEDLSGLTAPEDDLQREIRDKQNAESAARNGNAPAPPQDPSAFQGPATRTGVAGATRGYAFNELIGKQGGLTALHFAARQGALKTVQALVDAGANVNTLSADQTSALVIASINGQFDLAKYLLDHGADPNAATAAGMTALYAALNIEWAPRMFYPQPRAQLQQQLSYLDFMKALLDKGADPNARIRKKIWYTQYNFDLLRVDETGASPFWRAAYASDIAAMKLLLAHGADPNLTTTKGPGNARFQQQGGTRSGDPSRDGTGRPPVPTGGPHIPPLVAAAGAGYGEGFAANAHRFAPTGMLEAVKFLVEEVHVDVDARDADGNTALHNAAARGDNEMILYLVSKGADPKVVNRSGQTTVDMANGPVQRTQPYPETIKLLEGLGAKNNHRCVSC